MLQGRLLTPRAGAECVGQNDVLQVVQRPPVGEGPARACVTQLGAQQHARGRPPCGPGEVHEAHEPRALVRSQDRKITWGPGSARTYPESTIGLNETAPYVWRLSRPRRAWRTAEPQPQAT